MTPERAYRLVLHLYPRRFRREYGERMVDDFRELRADMRDRPVVLWARLLVDACRSAVVEHVDQWTCGAPGRAARWVAACVMGTILAGMAIGAIVTTLGSVLFPGDPGLIRNLPFGNYGLVIGLIVGGTQAVALRRHVRSAVVWTVGTGLAAQVAFEVAFMVGNALNARVVSYIGGVLVFALITGLFQAAMLRAPWRRVMSWTVWNVAAIAAGILAAAVSSIGIGPTAFRPHSPFLFYLMVFVIYPGVAGLTTGLVTVAPLARLTTLERGDLA
jgi:hypothetical protein